MCVCGNVIKKLVQNQGQVSDKEDSFHDQLLPSTVV